MKAATDAQQLIWQTRAYEYADGLHEITLGLIAMLLGCAITFVPAGTGSVVGVVGAVILAAVIYASTWVITQIRLRFIWPRTGYVRLNYAEFQRIRLTNLVFILAIEIALAVVMFLTLGYSNRIVMLAVGILLFYTGEWRNCRQARWLVVGLGAPFVALAVSMLPITSYAGVLVMMLYMGLGTLANGIYALSRYLRTAPTEPAA